jgi:hypothetical protein
VPDTLDDTIRGIPKNEYNLYAGFYQGLAWAQGAIDGPLKFSWPNELHARHAIFFFNKRIFFAVAADLDDEAQIHYFLDYNDAPMMFCTEDSTPRQLPLGARTSYEHFITLTKGR